MREGRESGVSPSGDGVCYIFMTGNHARNDVGIVVRFKNLFTLGTCFQVFFTMVLVTSNRIKSRNEHERRGNEI